MATLISNVYNEEEDKVDDGTDIDNSDAGCGPDVDSQHKHALHPG